LKSRGCTVALAATNSLRLTEKLHSSLALIPYDALWTPRSLVHEEIDDQRPDGRFASTRSASEAPWQERGRGAHFWSYDLTAIDIDGKEAFAD
jgi:hypothetical protein